MLKKQERMYCKMIVKRINYEKLQNEAKHFKRIAAVANQELIKEKEKVKELERLEKFKSIYPELKKEITQLSLENNILIEKNVILEEENKKLKKEKGAKDSDFYARIVSNIPKKENRK
ncbi:MAG: hypothetical protein ACRCZK_01905 [Oscillospiraceae bacterium]